MNFLKIHPSVHDCMYAGAALLAGEGVLVVEGADASADDIRFRT